MTGQNEKCLAFKAWDPFGHRVDTDTCAIVRLNLQPETGIFVILAILAFVGFDALGLQERLGFIAAAVLWTIVTPAHIMFYTATEIVAALLQQHARLGRAYFPLVGMVAFAQTATVVNAYIAIYEGRGFVETFDIWLAANGYVLVLIFELFFFAFVLPLTRFLVVTGRAPRVARAVGGTPPRQISVAGESFQLERILLIRSQQHYVQIVTEDGDHRLRARLVDLVDQTSPADGVLAHRSHWVARRAIAAFRDASGSDSDVLILVNGETLPVARPRRDAVRDWLREHCPDLIPAAA